MRRILTAIVTPVVGFLAYSWVQTFFSAAAAVSTTSCTTYDASIFGQYQGINVLANTLTQGIGCGDNANQIYKYVAILKFPDGSVIPDGTPDGGTDISNLYIAGGAYDCFTNAIFEAICPYTFKDGVGNPAYALKVFAFSEAQWTATGGDNGRIAADLANQDTYCSGIDGGVDAGLYEYPKLLADLQTYAGWTTDCAADEQLDVPVLAACAPLTAIAPPSAGGLDAGDAGDGGDAADASDDGG